MVVKTFNEVAAQMELLMAHRSVACATQFVADLDSDRRNR